MERSQSKLIKVWGATVLVKELYILYDIDVTSLLYVFRCWLDKTA